MLLETKAFVTSFQVN